MAPSSAQRPTHRKPYDRGSEDGNPQDSRERARAGFPGRFHDQLTPSPGANGLDTTLEFVFRKTIAFAIDNDPPHVCNPAHPAGPFALACAGEIAMPAGYLAGTGP